MSKPPLSSVPLLFPALSLSAGIAVGTLDGFSIISATALVAAAAALLMKKSMGTALAAVFLVGLTESHFLVASSDTLPTSSDRLYYSGKVTAAHPADRGQALRVSLTHWGADSDSMYQMSPSKIALSVTDFTPEYHEGQTIRLRISPEEIKAVTDLPDEIDPASNLLRQHIRYRAIAAAEDIRVTGDDSGVMSRLRNIAKNAGTLLYRSDLKPDTKVFLTTTLLGNAELLDNAKRDTFARAGIAHILALSGLHVGLIALIVSSALYPLVYFRKRNAALAVTLVVLWLYAFATGLTPSVVRAVTMASAYTLARIFQRRQSPLNSLCLAAIIILAFSPESLFSIGFQLSFAAVLAIILFADKLTFVARRRRLAYAAASYFAVSISAMIGTSVISMLYFHSFPACFLIANVAASILLLPLIGAGVMILLLSSLGITAAPLCRLADFLYSTLEEIATWVTSIPGSTADDIFLPGWTIIPMALSLAFLWLALKSRKYAPYCLSAIAVTAATTVALLLPASPVEQRIYAGRRTQRTDIILPRRSALLVLTTADSTGMTDVASESRDRYRKYMALRHIDSLRVVPLPTGLCRIGSLWLLSDTSALHRIPDKVRYLMISRGCRGSIRKLKAHTNADTIVFSSDMDLRLLRHRIDECERLNQPYISLRDKTFSFPSLAIRK